MVTKKKTAYEPIGEQLDFGVAIVQAARLLDEAAAASISRGDPNEINLVALSWVEVARLLNPSEYTDLVEQELDGHELSDIGEGHLYPMPVGFVSEAENKAHRKQDNNVGSTR